MGIHEVSTEQIIDFIYSYRFQVWANPYAVHNLVMIAELVRSHADKQTILDRVDTPELSPMRAILDLVL